MAECSRHRIFLERTARPDRGERRNERALLLRGIRVHGPRALRERRYCRAVRSTLGRPQRECGVDTGLYLRLVPSARGLRCDHRWGVPWRSTGPGVHTETTISHGFTRRSSLEALGNLRYSRFTDVEGTTQTLRSYRIGGGYRYAFSHDAALKLGYVYRKGQYGVVDGDDSQCGSRHRRGYRIQARLSFSRRSHLDFNIGSALLNGQQAGTVERKLRTG